jgi:hypothetical protein
MADMPEDLKARRREFDICLKAGDLHALAGIVGARDPFHWPSLFRAIGYLYDHGQAERLPELGVLARSAPQFSQFIWRALTDHATGRDGALDRLRQMRQGRAPTGSRLWNRLGRLVGQTSAPQALHGTEAQRASAYCWTIYAEAMPFDIGPGDTCTEQGPDILQFWDRDMPDDVAEAVAEFKALAGDRHHLFDAREAEDFLSDSYGPEAAETFRSCEHPAIQSDYFRLGYLALKGGFYIDADSRMRPGLTHLWPRLANKTVLTFQTRKPGVFFQNGAMAVPAGSALMAEAFAEAGQRLRSGSHDQVVFLAGPLMLRDVAIRLRREGRLGPIERMSFEQLGGNLLYSFNADYKRDNRHWLRWDKGGREA